ncbi:MAG: PPC domain-containing protein [Hyphomonadaceae bacterium]|nr:PPC domain-containing protein [Hyphomonadaceae bacterium]
MGFRTYAGALSAESTDSNGFVKLFASADTVLGVGGADTITADTATTASIAVGGSQVSWVNDPGDHDWFKITLTAGETYVFGLAGSGSTPLADPILRLYDAAGVLITSDDDGGAGLNSLLTFTATSSGTFYLDVGAMATALPGATL